MRLLKDIISHDIFPQTRNLLLQSKRNA